MADRDGRPIGSRGAWHTVRGDRWNWEPVKLDKSKAPAVLDLPAGECRLVLSVREPGARIDRLFITGLMRGRGHRIVGAVGINSRTGEFNVIKVPASR